MTDDLAEYIRRYRDDYTREAINQQLLSAGYTSVEIAAAWREVDGIHFSDPPRDIYREAIDGRRAQRFANSPRFWSILVGFLLLSYLVPGLLIYASFTSPNIGWLLTFGLVF